MPTSPYISLPGMPTPVAMTLTSDPSVTGHDAPIGTVGVFATVSYIKIGPGNIDWVRVKAP